MSNQQILFHSENIEYLLRDKLKIRNWIHEAILSERKELGQINYIFCDDSYLHEMNIQYLNHDTLTDIITFDNTDTTSIVSGDIFISIDRVKENASIYEVAFLNELHRVLIHGVLHLIGYKDKTSDDAKIMREKEDYYLSLATHLK